jgi:hypothetical protein
MSQENVETARQAAEAIDGRDRTAWLALHHEDCEVVGSRPSPCTSQVSRLLESIARSIETRQHVCPCGPG